MFVCLFTSILTGLIRNSQCSDCVDVYPPPPPPPGVCHGANSDTIWSDTLLFMHLTHTHYTHSLPGLSHTPSSSWACIAHSPHNIYTLQSPYNIQTLAVGIATVF